MAPFGASRAGLMSTRVDAIPDSENIHTQYIIEEESLADQDSITTFTDQSGNGHDLTGGDPVYVADEWNGNAVARFDGTDDELDGDISNITQPFTYAFTLQFTGSQSDILTVQTGDDSSEGVLRNRDDTDGLQARSRENLSTGTNFGFSSRVAVVVVYDAENSLIEVNNSQEASGDAGTEGLDRIRVGNRDSGTDQYFEGDLAESIVWDSRLDSEQRTDAFNYLDNKYDVS